MGTADVAAPSGSSRIRAENTSTQLSGIRLQGIPAAPLGQVAALDGMRALAVLAVLFYHARFRWLPGGFLGVSAFFTLSGFLITSLLLREWVSAEKLDFRRFWTRRGRRLLPAAWVTIALVIGMGAAGVWDTEQLRDLRSDVPYSLLSLLNWHFIRADRSYGAQFAAPSPLEHFWSLAVEQQFYVILPLIVMGVLLLKGRGTQRKRLRLLAVVLSGLIVLSATANGLLAQGAIDRAYFGTETRAAEILMGALLACFTLRRTQVYSVVLQRVLVLFGILAACITVWLWHVARLRSDWLYPWGFLLTAVCTSVIIFAGLQRSIFSRALSVAPLLWLGRISYGVYLLHWPIFLWLTLARTGLSQWPLFGLRLAVTLPCAVIMFRMLENPVRLGLRLKGRSVLVAGAGVAVVALLGSFLTTSNLDKPSSLRLASALSPAASTTLPPPAPLRTLSVGDGFIQSITATAGESDGLENSAHGVADCGLALGGWVSLSDGRVERDVERCAGVRQGWFAAVQAEKPEYVLVAGSSRDVSPRRLSTDLPWQLSDSPESEDFLRTDIADLVDQFSATGTKVVLLSVAHMRNTAAPAVIPDPAPEPDPDREVLRIAKGLAAMQGAPGPGFAENEDVRIDRYNALLAEVANTRGLPFLDLAAAMQGWPKGEFDSSLRPDGVGVSPRGAALLRDWIEEQLRSAANVPSAAAELAIQPQSGGVLDVQRPLPEAPVVTPRRQFAAQVRPSVLVVGDSVAHGYGFGLEEWAKSTKQIRVLNMAEFGCPIARGGGFRFQQDLDSFRDDCDWSQQIPGWLNGFQPDIVLLSSSIWEVVDRRFPGDSRFRHIGDPAVDRYVLSEFLTAIDLLASTGARVQVLTQAHINAGLDQGFSNLPESDPARIDRLNQILAEAVSLRPGVATLVDLGRWLAEQPGGDLNTEARPDGLHYTDEYLQQVANWLAPEVLRAGKRL